MDGQRLCSTTGKVIGRVVLVAALLLYGAALLSPCVSPLRTQIPAFLNLAFPLLLGGMLLLLLLSLLLKRRAAAVTLALVLLLSARYILTYIPLHPSALSEEHDLRVLTYNVANLEMRDSRGSSPALRLIDRSGADIVCLQESPAPEQIAGAGGRALLERYPHRSYRSDARLLVLSKYPIAEEGVIDYKSFANGSAWYLLRLAPERTLLLVNNHMESYKLLREEKEAFEGYFRDAGMGDLATRLLTLKRRLGPALNLRAGAANRVRAEVRSLREQYQPACTIVCGDLNDTPMSYCYRRMRDDLGDAFADAGCGRGISFNQFSLSLYAFRIDHLFYGGALRVRAAKIPEEKQSSDHNPLLVDFTISDTTP